MAAIGAIQEAYPARYEYSAAALMHAWFYGKGRYDYKYNLTIILGMYDYPTGQLLVKTIKVKGL